MLQANKLRQVGLGVQLRDMRHRAGMTTRMVSDSLGVSPSSVNRTECGRRAPDREEVASLCALFGITGDEKQDLLDRVGARKENTAWLSDESDQLASLLVLEREAKAITSALITHVYGLAQTGDYAHLVLSSHCQRGTELERQVTTRLGRQSVLSKPNPPQVTMFMDESVLYRTMGNPRVVQQQLENLQTVQDRENVSIRVIPLTANVHPLVGHSFVLYELADTTPYVFQEGVPFGVFACEPSEVQPFVEASASLNDLALDEQESSTLIKAAAERLADA